MALNLAPIIPAIFTGPNGEQLTPEQIRDRQLIAQSLMAQATDTSPNAGGWASILTKGVQGFQAGRERRGIDNAEAANGAWNASQASEIGNLLAGGTPTASSPMASATTSGVGQEMAQTSPAPTVDISGDKESFVASLLPAAMEESKRTGVDPRIIVAQAAQETGWGRSAPGNNYFGIKSHGQGGGQNLATHEYVNGKRVNVNDSFRTFESPADSVRGYGDFILQNPRYESLRTAQGLDGQLQALQASGYATDPNYSRSVGAIARGIRLPKTPAAAIETAAPTSGFRGSDYNSPMLTYDDKGARVERPYTDPAVSVQPQAMAPELPSPVNVNQAPPVAAVQQQLAQPASQPVQAPTGNRAAIAQALRVMNDPRSNPGTRAVANALLQREQGAIEAAQKQALAQQQREQEIARRQAVAQQTGINPAYAVDDELWKGAAGNVFAAPSTSTVGANVIDNRTGQPIYQGTPEAPTSVQEYEYYRQQSGERALPYDQWEIQRRGASAPSNIGAIPQGYQLNRDVATGSMRLEPIPNGPADPTKKNELAKANTERSGNIVLEDVDRAVTAIESNPTLTTGIIGNWSRGIGGTPANKVQNLLQTVRANSAFDRLQQMREASPTGGALGAVSDSELGLLQNAIGSLEQSNDSEDLTYNLRRVQRIYEDIIHGKDAAATIRKEREAGGAKSQQPATSKRLKFNPATGELE